MKPVEVCRVLEIDGEEVDCIVTVTLVPGGGDDRTEPRYGATVDEVLSVRTDANPSQRIDASLWPPGLEDDVCDAAVRAAADEDRDDFDDAAEARAESRRDR